MSFRVTLVLAIIGIFINTTLKAQSNTQDEQYLDDAVHIYNKINPEVDKLQASTKRERSAIPGIEKSINEAEALLDKISVSAPDDLSKTARYFRSNLEYNRGYAYGLVGNNKKMNDYLLAVKSFFDNADESYFPLKYKFEGKSYTIAYSNFESTRGVYYSALSEGCTKMKNYDIVPELARKGLSISKDNYVKVLMIDYLVTAKSKLGKYDEEMAEQSINYISTYNITDPKDKTVLDSFDYSYKRGWNFLLESFEKNPNISNQGSYFARAATALEKAYDNELAGLAYQKALDAGYRDKDFLWEITQFEGAPNKSLRVRACDALAANSYLDCYDMDRLSKAYSSLGMQKESSDFDKKARKCEAKRTKVSNHSSGGGFHLYLGTYPLRYLGHKDYRDYGAVGGFTAGKFMLLASYMKVNKNLYAWTDLAMKSVNDNSSDKYYWSGTNMDVALRFSSKKFQKTMSCIYFGPQFGFSDRKLTPIASDVTDPATGLTDYVVNFEPTDKQYQLALNYGIIGTGKVFAIDMSLSLGASYCNFSLDNTKYNLTDYKFSHAYLDNREDWHWGLVYRVNLTVGFYL